METIQIPVKNLKIDLENFRTIPQVDETSAVHAMIALEPDYFWALAGSLLQNGFLPNENIIVLLDGKKNMVKEGNRRVGALKMIFGLIHANGLDIPDQIKGTMTSVDAAWKKRTRRSRALFLNKMKLILPIGLWTWSMEKTKRQVGWIGIL